MKAIVLDEFGGPEKLRLAEIDAPRPAVDQLLIDVHATSVNRPDLVQRMGNYPPPKGDSEILGLEVAGTVVECGAKVTRYKPGDRVMALVGGGGYAEQAVASEGHAMPVPDTLDFNQAACVCETYITAWLNVFQLGRLSNSESVLLHGGGGGVNTSAIQIVQSLAPDSRIFVTASAGKIAGVRELGVDDVIDYRAEDFAERIKAATSRKGVDVILDHIGADYLDRNMKSLAVSGRLVVIGVMSGIRAELNLALMMVKRQQIMGSVLRSRSAAEKSRIIAEFEQQVIPLFATGTIAPRIDRSFALADAAQAHEAMEAGGHFGKLVLQIRP